MRKFALKRMIYFAFFFLWVSPFLYGEAPFALQRHFTKGEKKTYATLIFQRFEFPKKDTGKVKIKLIAKILLVYDLKTLSVKGGKEATMEWKFRRIYFYHWQAGMMFAYDTAQKKKQLQSPLVFLLNLLLKPLIGKTLKIQVDVQGKILKITGSEALFDKSLDSAPPAYQSFLKGATKKLFSAKAIRCLLRQSLLLFPAKKLTPGDSWQDTLAFPRQGAIAHYKYTFVGLKTYKKKKFIQISLKCTYKRAKDYQGLGGYEFIAGKGEGIYYLDGKGNLIRVQTISHLQVVNPNDRAKLKGKEVLKTWKTFIPPQKKKDKKKDKKKQRKSGAK